MTSDSVLEFEGLRRSYGAVEAVRGVSGQVRAGEVVVLVGPNGCGKTTLVEMLLGLRRRDAGTVRILGRDPRSDRAQLARRLGVTLQGAALHGHVSGREHLQFIAKLYDRPAGAVDRVADQLGLGPLLGRQYGRLSGGQQRRVMVAGAMLAEPALLVLDEPTSGVDMESRSLLWAAVRADTATTSMAVLTTTHDLGEAEDNGDRVLVMRDGTFVGCDSPEALVRSTGLVRVVIVRSTSSDVPELPAALATEVSVLQAGPGAVVVGCTGMDQAEALRVWADQLDDLRAVQVRPPSLADAYLVLRDRPTSTQELDR